MLIYNNYAMYHEIIVCKITWRCVYKIKTISNNNNKEKVHKNESREIRYRSLTEFQNIFFHLILGNI